MKRIIEHKGVTATLEKVGSNVNGWSSYKYTTDKGWSIDIDIEISSNSEESNSEESNNRAEKGVKKWIEWRLGEITSEKVKEFVEKGNNKLK